MVYVCLKSYLLEGEFHYDNSVTNRKRKVCPICESPVVDAGEVDRERDSFSEENDVLSEIVDDYRRKVMV
jgi:hypothetical protein